jgi:serine/threonine protein kinase
MSHPSCPDRAVYQQALAGSMPAEELESLAGHLESCPACGETVSSLTDPLQILLQEHKGDVEPVPSLVERILAWSRPGGVPTPEGPASNQSQEPSPALTPFLQPAQQADEIGRLGKYRILARLGQGGMGIVFHAEDTRLCRSVALKVMKPELAALASARARFLREARAMAAIDHLHVVPVYEADEVNVATLCIPYLAMPLLKGQPLTRWLAQGPLAVAEAVRVARETAEGLAAAHAAGLIHRDIKPSNLWLEHFTPPGQPQQPSPDTADPARALFRVKVLDFGLARAGAADRELSSSGTVLGTPAYMAPEQADGQELDARADLFSLGCVLYEMLTGKRPFAGSSNLQLFQQLATHHPPAPHTLQPHIPTELSNLVVQLLAKEPARRPASTDEVVERLRNLEQPPQTVGTHTQPQKPAASASPVLAPAARKERRWWRWALLLAVLILGGTGTMLGVALRPRGEPPPVPPLQGSLDVLIYDPDDPNRQDIWLDDVRAMPLQIGDQFSLHASLNRPAYMYVLWIDPDGTVQPVHPWRPGHWDDRPAQEEKADQLRWPVTVTKWYQIKPDQAGMITLVLLARDTPLPRTVDLREELGPLPRQTQQNLEATVWFENGIRIKNRRGLRGTFDETQREDPVLEVQERIRSRLLGEHFDYTLAVSFARKAQ